MRLDTETLCAALLHDTVEDTSASIEEVREAFGEEIAGLVDGVTKLTGLTFQSRDEAQAENYRKMMVAMASDVRVILIKLADRLHNMRTIGAMTKQKQIEKSRETLDIYAPIAHRLGIHAIKWELEDLAFQTLHPRKYNEIKGLVAQQRAERERYVNQAGAYLAKELDELSIEAEISGRAKHFYSIYSKMTKKGREFNEIYDLTAMRVQVNSVKDCYGAVGVIHSLWKPLPGRFKDFIAMPKFNMYQSLHTTVIGPEGRPLEIQIRTREMHDLAEYGIAAHWMYKEDGSPAGSGRHEELRQQAQVAALAARLAAGALRSRANSWRPSRSTCSRMRCSCSRPKGEVKSLAAGATPLDFAYEIHTDVGHRCVGAKVNGKIVPLSYVLRSGDIVEVLTSKRERGPSRDWLALVRTTRARNKIKAWFKAESRKDTEHTGRELLQEHLKKQGLPSQKLVGSPLLADVIREMGFRKGDDFYIALGAAKISPKVVVNKVMQRLKQGETAETEPTATDDLLQTRRRRSRPTSLSTRFGIAVEGIDEVMLRLAKCCRPVPGDPIVGYISLGTRDHHPPRGLSQRRRPAQGPRPLHPRELGWGRRDLVPGRDPGRRLGPAPPARGHDANLRRGRDQHPRRPLHRQPSDGQEPVRGRGGGHPDAGSGDQPPAQHRRGVRRVPRDAGRGLDPTAVVLASPASPQLGVHHWPAAAPRAPCAPGRSGAW